MLGGELFGQKRQDGGYSAVQDRPQKATNKRLPMIQDENHYFSRLYAGIREGQSVSSSTLEETPEGDRLIGGDGNNDFADGGPPGAEAGVDPDNCDAETRINCNT